MSIAFIGNSNGTYSIVVNGVPYVVNRDHEFYQQIVKELHGDRDETTLLAWLSVKKAVNAYTSGKVCVNGDEVTFNGQKITGKIVDRILELLRQGYDAKYLTLFLERVQANPSFRAVNELFNFLEHRGFPITEDGHFIGYKNVRKDYKDHFSGTYDNSVGCKPEMPRNKVDDNAKKDCSDGLHVGTLEYARNFKSNGRIMLVKVDPADVVSVPEYDTNKLRACKYEVLSEYVDTSNPLNEGVYSSSGDTYLEPGLLNEHVDDYEDNDDSIFRLDDLAVGDLFKFIDFEEEKYNEYELVYSDEDKIVIEDTCNYRRYTYSPDCPHRVELL